MTDVTASAPTPRIVGVVFGRPIKGQSNSIATIVVAIVTKGQRQ